MFFCFYFVGVIEGGKLLVVLGDEVGVLCFYCGLDFGAYDLGFRFFGILVLVFLFIGRIDV